MNANELADEVMEHYRAELPRGFNVNWMQEAATMLRQQQAEIEALKAEASPYKAITNTKIEPTVVSYTYPVKELTDEEINVVAILQDAEIVPVGHEIWKTGEEFNKYKRIVLATAKALRKAQEK